MKIKNIVVYASKQIKLVVVLVIIYFSYSCGSDSDTPHFLGNEIATIKTFIDEGNLLISIEEQTEGTKFIFETGELIFPATQIENLVVDKSKWQTELTFIDKTILRIPTLGDALKLDNLKLNPNGYTPLTVQVDYVIPVEGKMKIRIKSKDKLIPDVEHFFDNYLYNHRLNIHGLYADHLNTIYVTYTDKKGKARLQDTIQVQTESLSSFLEVKITPIERNLSKMEPGMTLVNYIGENQLDAHRPFMFDAAGEIRWILNFQKHPELDKLVANIGLSRMRNGNFLCGDRTSGYLYELNMMGEIVNKWDLRSQGYEFHHEVMEMPNSNFLLTATQPDSKNANGEPTINDIVLEVSRNDGKIITVWDLKKSLDETRNVIPTYTNENWAHDNAVAYSSEDDAIIVGLRHQGLVKLDRHNRVKWIISPHKDWGKNGRGEPLEQYLLNPLDSFGQLIEDKEVLQGYSAHDSFDWSWALHNPVLLDNGDILLFDNGYNRHYEYNFFTSYSRAVVYKIDESEKTVQQVWEYGKERGNECFSSAVSSVQYLPQTDHVLFCPGMHTINKDGMGGRVVEIDYKTREVVFDAEITLPTLFAFHRAIRMPLYP